VSWLDGSIYLPKNHSTDAIYGRNLLLAGSAFYTIGVLFYIQTKLAWHHAIWHIFVMLGCASHYIALFLS
jgi:hemolysin III